MYLAKFSEHGKFETLGQGALIRPVGHLLPFFEREKAKLSKIIAFSRATWHGRMWPKAG
jgi:hypothetical protein